MNETNNKQINWDSITCLVVDDDKFSRTFVKTALYQIGVKNTKEASTMAEAIEVLRNYKINVILKERDKIKYNINSMLLIDKLIIDLEETK